ncbi:hypothetical protein GCM10023196_043590 [Actinoallomurus vinaceus]|uniref:Uncharacterized protein n=1 Tax=Actinoallomurus vinaceus TaxID=1080074 RepID=A0ABP8UCI9_9ACTN
METVRRPPPDGRIRGIAIRSKRDDEGGETMRRSRVRPFLSAAVPLAIAASAGAVAIVPAHAASRVRRLPTAPQYYLS